MNGQARYRFLRDLVESWTDTRSKESLSDTEQSESLCIFRLRMPVPNHHVCPNPPPSSTMALSPCMDMHHG